MSLKEELTKAIGAHGMWKSRLRTAILNRQLDVPVELVRAEGNCEFGKWLLGPTMADELGTQRGREIRNLHAEFHRVAARVAELAVSGKKGEAENLMAESGEFTKVSNKLTLAVKAWRDGG